jgi:DNA repair protein RadC
MDPIDHWSAPEFILLRDLLRNDELANVLSRVPGGWRALTRFELAALGLQEAEAAAVVALQALTRRSYPELPAGLLLYPDEIAKVYGHRLGGLAHEVMLALALDNDAFFIQEVEIGTSTGHGLGLEVVDVLRPLVKAGARAFILVHNHLGDAEPTPDCTEFTAMVARSGSLGLWFVDHLIIGREGFFSFRGEGLLDAADDDEPG